MALPPRSRDQLIAAMQQFDTDLRESPEWKNWTDNKSHKYAIRYEDALYPVKQIISMATGTPVTQFYGGAPSNRYVRDRDFEIEMLHFPEESLVKSALHDLLLEIHPAHLLPQDAYRTLGDRFDVPEELRHKLMDDGQTVHWQNRIQWARQKLVSEGVLDNSVRGEWFLKERSHPVAWVEKSLVNGRPDREEGEHALGVALWSPLRSKNGGDIYKLMRYVQPDDVVLHLTDNRHISGISIADGWADPTFTGVEGTDWADTTAYRIQVTNFTPLAPPLDRDHFLGDGEFRDDLRDVLQKHQNQFFNANMELNQGAYITQAHDDLLAIFRRAYKKHADKDLPLLPEPQNEPDLELSASRLTGAKRLFTWIYGKQGFDAERYLNEERSYKESFSKEWRDLVNAGSVSTALSSGDVVDFATEVGKFLSDSRRSNLLPFWYNGALRAEFDEARATEFLRAIQSLLFEGDREHADISAFNDFMMPQYEAHMNEGRIKPASHCIPSLMLWLSYPDEHFFIRPDLINDVARCLTGAVLEGQGNIMTTAYYSRVLGLVKQIRNEIGDLEPRDMIDVQGFLWGTFGRKKIWFGGKTLDDGDQLETFRQRNIFATDFAARTEIHEMLKEAVSLSGAEKEQKKTEISDALEEEQGAATALLSFVDLASAPGSILLIKSTYFDRSQGTSTIKIFDVCRTGKEISFDEKLGHQLDVEWLSRPEYSLLTGQHFPKVNRTLSELPLIDALELLSQEVVIDGPKPGPTADRYTIQDCAQETGYSADQIRTWINRLKRKQQVVLQGPPGTGKTFLAERFARIMVSETEGKWDVVQFHPSYSYEDFMQGIRPRVTDQGHLTYDLENGRFLEFCLDAEGLDSDAPCVLIVDEINRANLSRVFGELMYLLEYREKEIPLSTGGAKFKIPPNVYIIGTMNTADRSIALVDHALRRRFSFIYLSPALDVLENHLQKYNLSESLVEALRTVNAAINDRHHEVGISYFMKDGEELSSELPEIWQGEIEPYLDEYFYDRPQQAEELSWEKLSQGVLADWT